MRTLILRSAALLVAAIVAQGVFSQFRSGLIDRAQGQAVPKSLELGGTDNAMKIKKNTWTVGVAGGLLSGTYMTFADELAQVLDDGDNLRVIPMVTYGAASNLDDLLYLRGVDIAMTQADVFEYYRTQRKTPNLENRVHYIIRLPVSEMHVLARNDIHSIEDLRGKKVNFGPAGSASSLTGSIVFQRLGVQVQQVLYDNPTAMQKLKSGELGALVRVIPKPIDFFAKIPANSGLHLVPIPVLQDIRGLLHAGRVRRGRVSDAGAARARYRHDRGAGGALRLQLAQEHRPLSPRLPLRRGALHEMGQVPQASPPSEMARRQSGGDRAGLDALALRRRDASARRPARRAQSAGRCGEFAAFLKNNGTAGASLSQDQREALFREFLQWQSRQHGGK